MPITLDGTLGITTPSYGGADAAEYLVPVTAFKNRIINGAMVIDQRNAGAAITPNNGQYSLDRWKCWQAAASKYTIGQYSTVPAGFTKSIGVSSNSSYSVGADEYFAVEQIIEGFNIADLDWGTANAKTVTLSFQVRSSLTGSFGGAINNGNLTRSYPFSYTISSANTWTTVSVTIPGDTTGTWNTNNDGGIRVWFSLGSGANNVGTANTWAGAWYTAPTGSVSVVGTSGANWYITGVQLEVGTNATSFDARSFTTEFALCQRYFETNTPYGTAPADNVGTCWMVSATPNTVYTQYVPFAVSKRAAPTVTVYRSTSGSTNGQWAYYNGNSWVSAVTGIDAKIPGLRGVLSSSPTQHAAWIVDGVWTASAEL